ncbi:hypothetical protein HTV80_33565 [Streptomyces sp. Vc74B-19]|uniref:hypothetical protein n=1 Tax=Streptomyces sp. Vc74B-19 TaxID=2741324 RepID=UPI001BFC663C|nr:hypothetical protein [Streptomyces sp. Vc74B-19]MBT3167980.1 hypothetical protein [Streptomyces sp. Vc74B-19]
MLNVRLTPVRATVPTVPTEPLPAPTVPTVEDFGTCTDCGNPMDTLRGLNGEIRAVFCEWCEFGC